MESPYALADELHCLSTDGGVLLRAACDAAWTERLRCDVDAALRSHVELEAVREAGGGIYAARNVLDFWPAGAGCWRTPRLTEFVAAVLGPAAGLVRILFFDKPPDQTWSLPFHKDTLIAIEPPLHISERYSPPRPRAGVLHTEPPLEVLEAMLTLRIHLDAATPENGPLQVLLGSHSTGKARESLPGTSPVTILAEPGDVFAMRPLLMHASGSSHPATTLHRRILHLEFAASCELPDGYRWKWFFN